MSAEIFLDTNVFVYQLDSQDARKAEVAEEIILQGIRKNHSCISLYQFAVEIQARHHFSFYDSLIVAAALDAGCSRLLTEDMQDGRIIDGFTIENPFKN